MNASQVEEIDALKSIFCKEGEFIEMPGIESYQVTIVMDLSQTDWKEFNTDNNVAITFLLVPDYPVNEPPKCFIKYPCLSQARLKAIESQIDEKASSLLGETMMMDLYCFAQELLEKEMEFFIKHNSISTKNCDIHEEDTITLEAQGRTLEDDKIIECKTSKTSDSHSDTDDFDTVSNTVQHLSLKKDQKATNRKNISANCEMVFDDTNVTAVLHLDHMRSRQGYVKLIKKWTGDLSLTGRLIFCQRFIFILLQGEAAAVKEYIVRNRTNNVDVDSKGRSCKERMLSVLCEISSQGHKKIPDFSTLELDSTKDLCSLFESYSMSHVFQQYLSNMVCRPGL